MHFRGTGSGRASIMDGMDATPKPLCCCFHRFEVHAVDGDQTICVSCLNAGPSRWFPHSHLYVPDPDLQPLHPRSAPGSPPRDLIRERVDLLFAALGNVRQQINDHTDRPEGDTLAMRRRCESEACDEYDGIHCYGDGCALVRNPG